MKKMLSLCLCLMLVAGILAVFPALTALAEGTTFETEVWKYVEIPLTSTVKYNNPYVETEIDATFTHTDGTVITTPGFWNGEQNWAVRFSPTKEGTWTFKITCKDASNTGLFMEGTVNAKASGSDNPNLKHGFVKVDGRHYAYADGTPFFWLGDTDWQAPQTLTNERCNYPGCTCGSQMDHIINDRVSKGFTVFQTYFSATSAEEVQGNKSYWDKTTQKVDPTVFNERIDHLFQYAFDKGLVIALGFGCHNATLTNMSEEDYFRFVRYGVARYACLNVVWITGQEITDTTKIAAGKTVMDVYLEGGKLTEELDGYKHPNSAHMYPMAYSDPRAQSLEMSDWHDAWVLQGGHGPTIKQKVVYQSYYNSVKKKPYIEGELNYEEINCGGFNGYDAPRWGAWDAVMNGCCGFTYGVDGVWCAIYSNNYLASGIPGTSSYSYEPWFVGITKPGSYEVSYMKKFFELLPDWTQLVPRFYDQQYADFAADEDKMIASTEDGKVIVCYFYNANTNTGLIRELDNTKTYRALWYDTRTGRFLAPVTLTVDENGKCELPKKPSVQDWALLITTEAIPGLYTIEDAYTDLGAFDGTGTKAEPVSFTAIGGVGYKSNKQTLIDPTANLIDGDPATVWKPQADRVSQTFLYDLGKAYNLSGVTVTPVEGTILPKAYRVEASNDGQTWTILVNTVLRNETKENTGINDKLAGAYRYVKVLLLNPEDMTKEEGKTKSYKVLYNKVTDQSYSRTEIADMTLFVNGEGTPAEITVVDEISNLATPEPDQPEKKKGCGSVIALTIEALAIPAAIVVRKKEE